MVESGARTVVHASDEGVFLVLATLDQVPKAQEMCRKASETVRRGGFEALPHLADAKSVDDKDG